MDDSHCPKCGSGDVVSRTVNDRLWAADPRGQTFEVALKLPMHSCTACKFSWQGQDAAPAMEAAYQNALVKRTSRAAHG